MKNKNILLVGGCGFIGHNLAIKLVETEAIIKNINTKIVTNKLSILPTISVGFVSILERLPVSCFKNASTPVTINKARKEKIIKFIIKEKFPFFNWVSFFTYREKSPKVKITIEKYAKIVPVTVANGPRLFSFTKFSKSNTSKKALVVNFTSLNKTEKKNNNIPR